MKPVDLDALDKLLAAAAPGRYPRPSLAEALLRVAPALIAELRAARAVVEGVRRVKAAQFGPMFWECDCGPLENLDEALVAHDSILAGKAPP